MERSNKTDLFVPGKSRSSNGTIPIVSEERLPRLLMVEDNPGDAFLLKQALSEAGFRYTMTVVPNGDEALAYLHSEGRFFGSPRPDLVLLDLNLPGKTGHEVLREIKEDSKLRSIPVIILSSSEAESDLTMAYDLHANCYIHKPSGLNETLEIASQIAAFWFSAVSLPRRGYQDRGRAFQAEPQQQQQQQSRSMDDAPRRLKLA
jgi:CheY-like chemotaxis protein